MRVGVRVALALPPLLPSDVQLAQAILEPLDLLLQRVPLLGHLGHVLAHLVRGRGRVGGRFRAS